MKTASHIKHSFKRKIRDILNRIFFCFYLIIHGVLACHSQDTEDKIIPRDSSETNSIRLSGGLFLPSQDEYSTSFTLQTTFVIPFSTTLSGYFTIGYYNLKLNKEGFMRAHKYSLQLPSTNLYADIDITGWSGYLLSYEFALRLSFVSNNIFTPYIFGGLSLMQGVDVSIGGASFHRVGNVYEWTEYPRPIHVTEGAFAPILGCGFEWLVNKRLLIFVQPVISILLQFDPGYTTNSQSFIAFYTGIAYRL